MTTYQVDTICQCCGMRGNFVMDYNTREVEKLTREIAFDEEAHEILCTNCGQKVRTKMIVPTTDKKTIETALSDLLENRIGKMYGMK